MTTSAQDLKNLVSERLGDGQLVVVSNREPYVHVQSGDAVVCQVPPGGLVTALDPVMRACGGTWVAHGSGDADRRVVDARDCVLVPPNRRDQYRLRRVWLSKAEEEGYYYGLANQALWPLCHQAFVRPRFEATDWETYRAVNRRFADAILDELQPGPGLVLIQDYHFALLPRMLKEARPELSVGHFWHIPWPSRDAFGIFPWAEELLDGMLGNDVLGFHTQQHCFNFINTVDRTIESMADYDHATVQRGGQQTLVRAFPISVDFAEISAEAEEPSVAEEAERLRQSLNLRGQLVGVGVDRLDYTKGIPERFRAIDRLFDKYPEYVGRFTFLQLGPVSRIHIPEYQALNDELYHLVVGINRKHGDGAWQPIRLLKANHPRQELLAYFRLADLCVVSSLHDGMNLVAKEFVAGRPDGDAALVLSRYTGAARELADAVVVNPFDVDGFADNLRLALAMPVEEKRRRFARMREVVQGNTVYDWASRMLTYLARVADQPANDTQLTRVNLPIVA
jgi:alpha,alpha-trehalose-phosphate synthase [UDP-forming]